MRIARVKTHDKPETYGIVSGNKISTMDEIRTNAGIPVPLNMFDFLFEGWLDEVRANESSLEYALGLDTCELLAPISHPGKIICAAFNYTSHASEHSNAKSRDEPVIVIKPHTALCGANADIVYPSFVEQLDYETELVVIIGKKIKCVGEQDAEDAIFGYMILNDVSARDIQFSDGQFTRAKSFDTFAPCGPWITTRDEVSSYGELRITTSVNDEARQDALAQEMTISPAQMISRLSYAMTLERGDIISTGTPGGTVLDLKCRYLADGDIVESRITGLGALRNTVRRAI